MKILKMLFGLLLSLLLAAFILLSDVCHVAPDLADKETLCSVAVDAGIGKKILDYDYPKTMETETDFYTAFSKAFAVTPVMALGLSQEQSQICNEGAIAYVKEKQPEKYAYLNLNQFETDLANGFTQTAVSKGFINPDQMVSYRNSDYKTVRTSKEVYLQDTMKAKYHYDIVKLLEKGFFCTVDLDQKDPLVYLLSTAESPKHYGIYPQIENAISEIYGERLYMLEESILQGNGFVQAEPDDLLDQIKTTVYDYLDSINISTEQVSEETIDLRIRNALISFICPKLNEHLPSDGTLDFELPSIARSALNMLKEGKLFYVSICICAILAVLLLLILKGKALFFIGLSAVVSGAFIFLSKTDLLYPSSQQLTLGSAVDIIIPDLVKVFIERFASCGPYLLGGGLMLMALSFLLGKKTNRE